MTSPPHVPRARATHSMAPLPLQDALLTTFISEHTAQQVRDVYLRVTAASEPHAHLLWIRYQVARETNRTCLRGVPTPIAEAVRVIVLEDLRTGTDAPLLPRVRERFTRIGGSPKGHRSGSADTPDSADTPLGSVSPSPAGGPGRGAPGAVREGES
jgi:hypothetical protein